MIDTYQVATAPCTDCVQVRFPTLEAKLYSGTGFANTPATNSFKPVSEPS
jgi:hypothetical protein